MRLRDLNSFILTGAALLVIAVIGLIRGNQWLSEPGMPVNPYGWQIYLVASVIMFVNGFVSIKLAREREAREATRKKARASARAASGGGSKEQ